MSILNKIGKEFGRGKQHQRMSFDMKLSYAYFLPMMFLFMASGISDKGVPVPVLLGVPATLLLALCLLSILHKIKHGWRWPGVTVGNVFGTLLNVLWGIVFLVFVAGIMLPAKERPWHQKGLPAILNASWEVFVNALLHPFLGPFLLFGAGIVVFNTFRALKFVVTYEDEFRKNCSGNGKVDISDSIDAVELEESEPEVPLTFLGMSVASVEKVIGPLCWLAGIGFMFSAVAHIAAIFGTDMGRIFPPIWLFHLGVFVVWFPAVLVMSASNTRSSENNVWKVAFKHAPLWMRILCFALFPYALFNFMYMMDKDPGRSRTTRNGNDVGIVEHVDKSDEGKYKQASQEGIQTRMFSGHWIIFYLVGWTVLVSHRNKGKKESSDTNVMEWHYSVGGEAKGPFGVNEIRRLIARGIIRPETHVWNTNMGQDWQKASDVPELSNQTTRFIKRQVIRDIVQAFLMLALGVLIAVIRNHGGGLRGAEKEEYIKLKESGETGAYETLVKYLGDGKQVKAEGLLKYIAIDFRDSPRIQFMDAVCARGRWRRTADSKLARITETSPDTVEGLCSKYILNIDDDPSDADSFRKLEEQARLHPDNPFVLWLVGIASRTIHRETRNTNTEYCKAGAEAYRKLIEEMNFGPVMVHHTYANILCEQLGQHEQALKHREIVVTMTNARWARQGYANTLRRLGRYEEADKIYSQLLDEFPFDAGNLFFQGKSLQDQKKYSEAISNYKKAYLLNPRHRVVLRNWGECLYAIKDYEKAMDKFDEHLKHRPNDVSLMLWLGNRYHEGKTFPQDYNKAFEYYKKCSDAGYDTIFLNNRLGFYYMNGHGVKHDIRKAIAHLTKSADKNDEYASTFLAWIYSTYHDSKVRDLGKALKYAAIIQKYAFSDWCVAATMAAIYARQNDFNKAVTAQQRAIDLLKRQGAPNYSTRMKELNERQALYKSGKPYTQKPQ